MKNYIFLFLVITSFATFCQSPWTKNKNEGYIQLSFTNIGSYDKLFGNPDYTTARKVTDNTLQLYSEYGLSSATTIFANFPLKMVQTGESTSIPTSSLREENKTALGNIGFGVKHNFYNKKWLLSGQLTIEANTGSYFKESGLRTGYDAWSFTPLLLAGRSFNNWYIQAFTGFDIRTNNYSANYKLGGEIGYKPINWLWVAGFLDGVASLNNGIIVLPSENLATGLYINNQSYAAFGLKFIGAFSKSFGATIGLGGAFAGRNVAKAPALSFGLYHKI